MIGQPWYAFVLAPETISNATLGTRLDSLAITVYRTPIQPHRQIR